MASNRNPSYETQYSNTSTQLIDNEASGASPTSSALQYDQLQIRLCRKPAPTIATGRRPKHLVLFGEEAIKREKRRERNREAARKLKEKRQSIEDELLEKLDDLQHEHANLQNHLEELRQKKKNLQHEINDTLVDPLDKLLSNNNQNNTLFFEEYVNDLNLFEESIENILNCNSNSDVDSMINNEYFQ